MSLTYNSISSIIEKSKKNCQKSICFITGVPGAGKTLAGLNIANERHKFSDDEHAVFLSGNGPLVEVLQEALSRNESQNIKIKKTDSLRKAKAFIQNIHHFRDAAIISEEPPVEKVVVFDEAQRAWTKEQTESFMKRKKGVPNFEKSEPEFLISIMDRHSDWAVIICLIGGGQEINTGEAGLLEWFSALRKSFNKWNVYVSKNIYENEYTRGLPLNALFDKLNINEDNDLHLATSIRSFRAENLSKFIKYTLDIDFMNAKFNKELIADNYPIAITRDFSKAKAWLKQKARGSERYGLLASSGAKRLKPYGITVQTNIEAPKWFLNANNDVRSSCYLEDVATEFLVQGLELDWTCVAWDADLRFIDAKWDLKEFVGTKWQNVNGNEKRLYLINSYRVLLTRARQGMVIFIPLGSADDPTRLPEFYDGTYMYLKQLGLTCLD